MSADGERAVAYGSRHKGKLLGKKEKNDLNRSRAPLPRMHSIAP